MSEQPQDVKRWGWPSRAAIIVALLVLYPLCIGPAFWLVDVTKSEVLQKLFGVIYLPLTMLAYKSNYGYTLFVWYGSLWVSDGP